MTKTGEEGGQDEDSRDKDGRGQWRLLAGEARGETLGGSWPAWTAMKPMADPVRRGPRRDHRQILASEARDETTGGSWPAWTPSENNG
jgi:hypothetical protein